MIRETSAMHRTTAAVLLAGALTLGLGGTARAQKEAPPPVGTPKDFKLPPRREFTLPNGLAVTLVPFGTVPKATISLAVRTGRIDQRANQVWLPELTADLMNEGTAAKSSAQVAEQVAGMGGTINVGVASDVTNIGGDVLSERAPEMVRLVAEVARTPRLPESEIERIKGDRLRNLAIAKSQPQPIATEKFRELLYGDHPYGHLFPTEAGLQGFTIAQVRDYHARNFGAARSHLYVAGVFDAAAVEAAIRQAFGDWQRGPAPTSRPPAPKSQRTLALIDRPDAVQSTVIIGLPVPGATHKDYIPLLVTDALLGGSFGSRITSNIREDKGYTYSPFSTVANFRNESYWYEQADVTTAVTGASMKEIFGEIERLQNTAPPTAELDGIKNNLAGIFTLQNGSRGGIIGQLSFVDLQGLPDSYLTDYVRNVLAVTPQEVQRIAREHLRPEKMAIVVVGDRKTVAGQVTPYNSVVP
jgi:predicted Zn-dependent peptidase